MFRGKYSSTLTIILICVITGIVIIAAIVSAKAYKTYKEDKNRERQIAEFQEEAINNSEEDEKEKSSEGENIEIKPIEINSEENGNNQSTSGGAKTKLYNNKYPMIGYIEIQGKKYPILMDISPAALEVGVGVMYPSNPKLNSPGNTVIIGHNYRNGKLFSNNKNLVIGDKIKITDATGKTLTYTIYEIDEKEETNTEYITRDRGNNIEISLSTCTDDGKARLVILARAE